MCKLQNVSGDGLLSANTFILLCLPVAYAVTFPLILPDMLNNNGWVTSSLRLTKADSEKCVHMKNLFALKVRLHSLFSRSLV